MDFILTSAFFCFGAVLASFITVIAERLYTGQSWVSGRSRCNSCSVELTSVDLVPVASWVFFRGRCRTCGSKVPLSYAVGELTLGVLFGASYLTLGLSASLAAFLIFLSILAFIVLYDFRHTVVPRTASWLLLISAGIYAVLASGTERELGATLLFAGCVSLFFLVLHVASKGRAMGLGDAPVALAMALMVGSTLAVAGLLFSFWIGGVVGIAILAMTPRGHRMGIEVPFVPFLAAGYLLAFFTQWNPLPLF